MNVFGIKKHYEYMNGIIQELHAELGELAEKILKTETKRRVYSMPKVTCLKVN